MVASLMQELKIKTQPFFSFLFTSSNVQKILIKTMNDQDCDRMTKLPKLTGAANYIK